MISTFTSGIVTKDADAVIVVISETPYAEGKGDRKELTLASDDLALVNMPNSLANRCSQFCVRLSARVGVRADGFFIPALW